MAPVVFPPPFYSELINLQHVFPISYPQRRKFFNHDQKNLQELRILPEVKTGGHSFDRRHQPCRTETNPYGTERNANGTFLTSNPTEQGPQDMARHPYRNVSHPYAK